MYDYGTAKITATHDATYLGSDAGYELHLDRPELVRIEMVLPSLADAEAFVAKFPKSLGFKAGTLYGSDNQNHGFVSLSARLAKDGVRGEKNETGIKRYRRAMTLLQKADVPTTWGGERTVNAYRSREIFEANI